MKHNKRQKAYQKGLCAETLAVMVLAGKGYKILEKRYKTQYGEIDILARKGTLLAAIEVKSRQSIEDALYALTPKSRARIQNSLLHYIAENPQYADYDLRFDLFAHEGGFSFRHLDNAWMAGS